MVTRKRKLGAKLLLCAWLLSDASFADQCSSYTIEAQTDYRGADVLDVRNVGNITQCCQLCMDTVNCLAFSFNTASLSCFARAGRGTGSHNSNIVSGYKPDGTSGTVSAAVIWIPVFAFVGCMVVMSILACLACRRRSRLRRRQTMQMQPMESALATPRWAPTRVCVMCGEAVAQVSFSPCGHQVACPPCAAANDMRCPLCTGQLSEEDGVMPRSPSRGQLSVGAQAGAQVQAGAQQQETPPVDMLVAAKLKEVDEDESYLGRSHTGEDGKLEGPAVDAPKMPMCIICFDRPAGFIFIPCGHLCCCEVCVKAVIQRCPYCNQEYQQKMKVFADL